VKQAVAAAARGALSARCPTRTPSPSKVPATAGPDSARGKAKSDMRKRSVSCAKAAIQQCCSGGEREVESEDQVELDFSPDADTRRGIYVAETGEHVQTLLAAAVGGEPPPSGRRASRVAEAWLRLARIALLELGTRGPEPSADVVTNFNAGRRAHQLEAEGMSPAEEKEDENEPRADWRSPKVCLSYLLEQSVTWIDPESDEDDFHSPKASLQQPPDEDEELEVHPGMKAIAQQQRAPGIVEGLPKCLSF